MSPSYKKDLFVIKFAEEEFSINSLNYIAAFGPRFVKLPESVPQTKYMYLPAFSQKQTWVLLLMILSWLSKDAGYIEEKGANIVAELHFIFWSYGKYIMIHTLNYRGKF